MCPKKGGQCILLYASPMLEVHVGYSWDIRGVFTEYSWGIRMYRVCIGYVSGIYRKKRDASGFFDNLVERQ